MTNRTDQAMILYPNRTALVSRWRRRAPINSIRALSPHLRRDLGLSQIDPIDDRTGFPIRTSFSW